MSNKKPRAVVTHWVHKPVIEFLQQHCVVVANEARITWSRERLLSEARQSDAMMAFMPDSVNEAFLSECPQLKIVAAALKGPDNFDINACTRRGVWFTLVPDLLTVPTAELAIALLLGITRRVLEGDGHVRSGEFRGWRPELYGTGMIGRTVGIIGMGAVGRAIAIRLTAFGVRVLYADPREATLPLGVVAERADLDAVISRSDFLMPLTHLNHETCHMIGARALAMMKQGSYLINVGRGSLVDEAAVAAFLNAGHLAGYAADVFEMEDWALESRPREINPLLRSDRARTLFTPHIGSAVDDVRQAIAMEAAMNIVDALEGRRPRGAMNNIDGFVAQQPGAATATA
jgi:phosphonate dehydrogenase